jgi:hypothetical protein
MFSEYAELSRTYNTRTAAQSPAFMGEGEVGHGSGVRESSPPFSPDSNDPHKFMAKIDVGRSTSSYKRNSEIYAQGANADSIFYLQQGRVRVTVASEQ